MYLFMMFVCCGFSYLPSAAYFRSVRLFHHRFLRLHDYNYLNSTSTPIADSRMNFGNACGARVRKIR